MIRILFRFTYVNWFFVHVMTFFKVTPNIGRFIVLYFDFRPQNMYKMTDCSPLRFAPISIFILNPSSMWIGEFNFRFFIIRLRQFSIDDDDDFSVNRWSVWLVSWKQRIVWHAESCLGWICVNHVYIWAGSWSLKNIQKFRFQISEKDFGILLKLGKPLKIGSSNWNQFEIEFHPKWFRSL